MDKLLMCRICLIEDVRMYKVVNKNLHELYEKLTANPFVTEDRRPILACFFCCTKLKQCCQFQRKCLEAEELFAQMLIEDYEPNPLMNPDQLEFFNGFSQGRIMHVNIIGKCRSNVRIASDAVKEELPASEVEVESLDNSYSDEKEIQAYHFGSEVDVSSISIPETTAEVSKKKRRVDPKRPSVTSKSTVHVGRIKLQDVNTEDEMRNEELDPEVISIIQNRTSNSVPKFQKIFTYPTPRVNNSTFEINNSDTGDIRCRITEKDIELSIPLFEDDLSSHQKRAKEKCFKCDICPLSFYTESHLRLHMCEKPYKCEVCQHTFSQEGLLNNHMITHKVIGKYFECDICQRGFNQKQSLKRHIIGHTGEKLYKCQLCPFRCYQKSDLIKHTRIHTREKPYKCDVCQYRFRQSGHLIKHIRTHEKEGKLYKCALCQFSSNIKNVFFKHIRVHIVEKPYECEVYQQSFSLIGNLKTHILIHPGEKLYKCEICQYGSKLKSDLTKHMRKHTGEKPFKCKICQQSFTQSGSLTNHFRKHVTM